MYIAAFSNPAQNGKLLENLENSREMFGDSVEWTLTFDCYLTHKNKWRSFWDATDRSTIF